MVRRLRGAGVPCSDIWSGAMQISKASIAILLGAATVSVSGCKGVDRFDTGPTGAYCGEMVSGATNDGLVPDVSLDAGVVAIPALKLALTLDTHHLTDIPGTLSSNDANNGLCPGQPLFQKSRVRTIERALHDVISGIQMTQDHEQDVFTWVDSSCQGTFVAVVSLMVDSKVEVRLFKPMREAEVDASANTRSGFGVFSLERSDTGCGF